MFLARTNDSYLRAHSVSGLRFLYVDVSETTRRLAALHGYAPPAAVALGKVLAVTAAFAADRLWEQQEPTARIALGFRTDGRVGGADVEIDSDGHLTGALHEASPETLIPAPDANPADDLLGSKFSVRFSMFTPTQNKDAPVDQDAVEVETPDAPFDRFFEAILGHGKFPTRMAIAATSYDNESSVVRLLAVQNCFDFLFDDKQNTPPEAKKRNVDEWNHIAPLFRDGTIRDAIEVDPTLPSMRDLLDIFDLQTESTVPLTERCTCSREIFAQAIASENPDVLRAWIRTGEPQRRRCHLCGRVYEFDNAALRALLPEKK